MVNADFAFLMLQAHSPEWKETASQSRQITSSIQTELVKHQRTSGHACFLHGILGNTGCACYCV